MKAIDLFAGAGGFSTGATMAGCEVIWAANHWPEAVQVHANNHPATAHACQDLQQADWSQVPAHDLLLASPACQGHSRARGKERPHHDAQRSTAWSVVSALECHLSEAFVVENVVEFGKWKLFETWADALRKLGYALSMNVIDAADHGVPQHRKRLIILGTRSKASLEIRIQKRKHVAAMNFINFESGRWSEVNRPGRSLATLARIAAGRARHGPRFLQAYYGNEKGGRSLDRPIGTITTRDRWAVVDGEKMRMVSVDEAKIAMAFPSTYQLPERSKDAMKMLGNAVCPPVARDVIQFIRQAV